GAPVPVAAPEGEAPASLALPLVEPTPAAPTARSRAAQLALELLRTHEPPALAPAVDRRLRRLLGEV
ncbi:MAG TPA: hypothetical protein VLA35_07635, partial [Thermoleophilia bacterium]|nr:hypothetical protein [Thermoleophilia bacterium]